ncbi:energy-coupling factor transporter transmembrane component T family protein [Clostridium aciditolerans]|uniref:Energy-coupling factor transporter transmembrane protein EcfT n=1 Tax=Clostridium aciditolerans TaxID=339861 RepID=A0A934HTJ4_9CLOT|nr:energy-coupling factor transporter transmembrane component T [Clostridium aciditolerans]MBI6871179.1 energy-coupling factor transporter transmembrane protein EcfT [Clostridium aciditolerans]
MEEWLFKKDNYVPQNDEDKFIDKSIFSILHVLSLIKRSSKINNGFIYNINSVVKVLFTVLNIIFLSMSKNLTYILLVDVYFLLILSLLDVEDIKKVLSISLVVPLFTLVMLTPSIIMGNVKNSILLITKVIGTIVIVNILSYTTKWHDITKALKLFFIPDVFILVFDITIKYIYILGEFSLEMFYALRLRSIGKNDNKYSSVTRIMGNLFLKSKEMGDEMYSAMECRGFTGEYSSYTNSKVGTKDLIYGSVNMLVILLYFYFARM